MEKVRKFVPEDDESKIDLNAYWKIVWRKKHYLFIPLLLSIIIAVVGVRQITPVYESSTLLAVEDQNILARTMERYIAPVEERSRDRDRQFKAMIETRLGSRTFLELVIEDLGLHRSLEIRQIIEESHRDEFDVSVDELVMRYIVSLLRDKISVQNTQPGFISISVLDPDPTTSYILAKKITEKYIDVTQQAQLQGLRQAGAFSDEQLAIYREKLETSEKALAQVRREMLATDVESNPVNSSNIHVAEARRRTLRANINNTNLTLKRVRERLTAIFGLVPSTERIQSDERIMSIEERLIAYSEEQVLIELSEEDRVSEVREIQLPAVLLEDLRGRITEIVNAEYNEFAADLRPLITEYFYQRFLLDFLSSGERKLQSYIDQYRENVERQPHLEREFSRLSQEVETNRSIYQAFLESKTSAQITEAVQATNLGIRTTIIEEAEKPFEPVKPDKLKIILVAVIFGSACGVGAILITEYMDDSFRAIDEVQRVLKVPVLGTVPKTAEHFEWEWEKQQRGRAILIWIIGIFLFVSAVSGSLYIYARKLTGTSIGTITEQQAER